MKKILQMLAVLMLMGVMCLHNYEPITTETVVYECKQVASTVNNIEVETITLVKEETRMSEEDIALIALVTMAEAEGECEEGKRLVIDTILNRMDSEKFPNTVCDVIYQKGQFSSMWNGRANKCYVDENICQLVREELEGRTNSDVIFFRTGNYSEYGEPLFQVENHYFSSC